MNPKKLLRIIVTLMIAVIGVWQYQSIRDQTQAQTEPSLPQNSQTPQPGATPPDGNTSQAEHHQGRGQRGERGDRTAGRVGDFDYYLVSLSWSPSYCVLHPDDQRQCGKGYGFVLHGLWPQKMSGGYPQECESSEALPDSVVRKALPFMPSEKLIHHEWTKHGTCSGLTADAYFSLADRVFAAVRVPAKFEHPPSAFAMSADEVLREFVAANPQVPANTFTVQCSGNELQEVRLCMSPEAKAQACGRGVRTQCRDGPVQVPASR